MNDTRKRAHVLKHSHRGCLVGDFDKILHEGSIWTGQRAVLYFILQIYIFLHFVHHGTKIYDIYINSDDRRICRCLLKWCQTKTEGQNALLFNIPG